MNILIVTPEFPPKVGGIGRSTERLANALLSAGHGTTILTYHRTDSINTPPYTLIDSDSPVRVLRVGPIAAKFSGATPEMKAFLKRQFLQQSLLALARCSTPDVVLSLGLVDCGFVGLAIANALQVPHVVSARGADVGTELFQAEKFGVAKWVISQSAVVTFVNEYLFSVVVAVFGESSRFRVIHNGVADPGPITKEQRTRERVTLRQELKIPLAAHVIGWTGGFRFKKGIPYLDEAFRKLVHDGRDVYLLIVGGPRNDKEREYCPSMDDPGLSLRVRCVGMLARSTDVSPYYQAMDVFAYPSLDDGLSNSLLEAMSFGVPVVATDIFQDVIQHEITALLVPRFNASLLAQAIMRILDDGILARTLARAAKQIVRERFSPTREADSYLKVFRELVSTTQPA